jgi:hypothetical protein
MSFTVSIWQFLYGIKLAGYGLRVKITASTAPPYSKFFAVLELDIAHMGTARNHVNYSDRHQRNS